MSHGGTVELLNTFLFVQISEYFIAILDVFGETANLGCSGKALKGRI